MKYTMDTVASKVVSNTFNELAWKEFYVCMFPLFITIVYLFIDKGKDNVTQNSQKYAR